MLPPLAMWPAFPASDYYGGSAMPDDPQRATRLPTRPDLADRAGGWSQGSSHVHH